MAEAPIALSESDLPIAQVYDESALAGFDASQRLRIDPQIRRAGGAGDRGRRKQGGGQTWSRAGGNGRFTREKRHHGGTGAKKNGSQKHKG